MTNNHLDEEPGHSSDKLPPCSTGVTVDETVSERHATGGHARDSPSGRKLNDTDTAAAGSGTITVEES